MSNQQEKTELEQIKELLLNWLHHWYYFLISLVICGGIGILYMKLKTPEYEINAKVLVRKDDNSGGLSEMPLMKSLVSGLGKSSGTNINDEANIMTSQGSIKKIVSHLELNEMYILSEYLGLWKTDLYDQTPIKIEYPENLPDSLSAVMQFFFSAKNESVSVKIKANKSKVGTYEFNEFPASVQTPYGTFTFNKTLSYGQYGHSFKLNAYLFTYGYMAQIYGKMIVVEPEKKMSDLLNLSIEDTNIPRACKILSDVIATHNEVAAKEKELVGEKTRLFITNRLNQVGLGLDSMDTKIKDFKEFYKLTDIEADATAFMDQQTKLMPMLLEAKAQLEITKILDDFLADSKNEYAPIPLSGFVSNEALDNAIIKYNEELGKRNDMVRSSKKVSPVSQSLNEQLSSIRSNLLSAMQNAKDGLLFSVKYMEEKQAELDKRFSNFPIMEKQYLGMRREQEVQQAVYIFLQQKKEESAVTSVSVMPKLRIIDEPYALIKPVAPNLMKTLLMVVFFGGILIPIAAIYLIPSFSRKPKKAEK